MIKKLRKVGNSNALILDRAILELVGLEEGGEVRLTVHNGSLIITPTKPKPVDKEHFEKCLRRGGGRCLLVALFSSNFSF